MTTPKQMVERRLRALLPSLLLIAVAWCMATGGGTGARDLAIVGALLAAAFLVGAVQAGARLRIVSTAATAMLVALLTWLLVDGPLRSGLDFETVRAPILVVLVVMTVNVVRFLDSAQRALVLRGLIVVGTVHASMAVAEVARELASGLGAIPLARADSLLGNANALGVVLVATSALSARELQRRRTPLLAAALAVQGVALLLTGSRLAMLAALVVFGWYWTTQATRMARALLAPWAAVAVVMLAFRFAHSLPDQRLQLWMAAAGRIALRPMTGHGPTPRVYEVPLVGATPTTHAHNEVLQWATEYGLIGLVLASGTLILALGRVRRTWPRDGWLLAAAASLLASGLTDFSLRITAVTIMSAAMTAAAMLPARQPAEATCGAGPASPSNSQPAMCSAMAIEEVAAGEGALRMATTRPWRLTRKSSTRLPSRATAWARTPLRARSRSDGWSSGT
jgi:O-antigen ligase